MCGDALGIHLGCIGDALGKLWRHIGDALGTHWGYPRDASGMLWERIGDTLGTHQGSFGIIKRTKIT